MSMASGKSISYVNIYFPPFRGAGAVRAISFLRFFSKNNFKLTVYAPAGSTGSPYFEMVQVRAPLATNKDRIIKRLFFEILYSIEVFFRVILHNTTDYAILSSPSFFVTFFASIAFNHKGTKVVVDIRDLYPEVLFRLNIIRKKSFLGKIFIGMERKLYQNAYKVLIANCYESECTRELPPEKLLQVRNGYDAGLFDHLSEKYDDFTICYHGNLGKLYDVDLLKSIIDALNDCNSGIKFLIIGKGSKDGIFKTRIPNVTYINEVKHEDIASHISRCHLGLSTTNGDDFVRDIYPVKIFEYIGAKIPSIVIPRGVSGAMVEKHHFGYQFENDELSLIVDKIMELKNNQVLYDRIVQNLSNKRENFTRESQLQKVLEVLSCFLVFFSGFPFLNG